MGLFGKVKSAMAFSFDVRAGAPPLTAQQQRGLALGAVYATEGVLPINVLTAGADAKTAQKVVAGPWDATDPASALANYDYLLGGGHNTMYQLVQRTAATVDPTLKRKEMIPAIEAAIAAGKNEAVARGVDPVAFERSYLAWQQKTYAGLPGFLPDSAKKGPAPTSIVAWDAARVVQCSRLFVDAGFVLPDQAWQAIAAAVEMSRPAYSSWQEFNDGFLVGRLFWSMAVIGKTPADAGSDVNPFCFASEHLFTVEGSPWLTIPW